MKATLKDIVVEARELFRRHGYDGASMQDLAERVGLKKASLYTRFPNKEALVPEVLALTLAEATQGLSDHGADWRARYAEVLTRFADTLTDARRCIGLHLAYGVSDATPTAQAAVREFFRVQRESLAAILAEGMPADEADAVAADSLARLEGATLWLATMDDGGPMRRALAELIAAQAPKA
jgi:TetR/AcrR family transcriptional repressor of nem operon